MLGVRFGRGHLQFHDEDGERRFSRGAGDVGPAPGIQLEPSRGGPKSAGEVDEKQLLYRAVAWAEEQFHQYLQQAAEAEPARQYLRNARSRPKV